MTRAIAILTIALLAIAFVACGDDDDGGSESAQRTSGVPFVDSVVLAITNVDLPGLRSHIAYQKVKCVVEPVTTTDLPCPPGAPEGTEVDGLPVDGCQPGYTAPEQLVFVLGVRSIDLYAVYKKGDQYVAVFKPKPGTPELTTAQESLAATIQDGKILRLDISCNQTTEQMIEGVPAADFVLPPPESGG